MFSVKQRLIYWSHYVVYFWDTILLFADGGQQRPHQYTTMCNMRRTADKPHPTSFMSNPRHLTAKKLPQKLIPEFWPPYWKPEHWQTDKPVTEQLWQVSNVTWSIKVQVSRQVIAHLLLCVYGSQTSRSVCRLGSGNFQACGSYYKNKWHQISFLRGRKWALTIFSYADSALPAGKNVKERETSAPFSLSRRKDISAHFFLCNYIQSFITFYAYFTEPWIMASSKEETCAIACQIWSCWISLANID